MPKSANEPRAQYDLFVVYADADEAFVRGYLLAAVGLPRERSLLSSELEPGNSLLTELERGIEASRVTVAVLSAALARDRWGTFGEQLAGHAAVTARRLVPLWLTDYDLPLRLDFRVKLDYRDSRRWEAETSRLRALLEQPDPVEEVLPCPYPGMRPFCSDDATRFYGREREVDELVARLHHGEREILLIGPSGSGKSSLMTAGVLPRLIGSSSAGGNRSSFIARTVRPGEEPVERLAEALGVSVASALAEEPPDTQLVLVLDQLEELFTLASEEGRHGYAQARQALRHEPRCQLVLILRADFYGALMDSTLWSDLEGRLTPYAIAPPRGDALRRAIDRPARGLGVFLEPALLERLLADAAAEPGALPLLQEALVQLWDRGRSRRYLTLAAYDGLGEEGRSGLAVALSRRADATLHSLNREQQAIARRILLRLVSFGEGRADTRRQQLVGALRTHGENPADFERTLRQLVQDRLLTADGDAESSRVDLSHEALVTAWPTFSELIRVRHADERARRVLESKAAEWVSRGCGRAGLLDEDELVEAQHWLKSDLARELGHSEDLFDFAAISAEALAAAKRRERRRWQVIVGGLVAFVTALSVTSWMALQQMGTATSEAQRAARQRHEADRQRREAERQRREAERQRNKLGQLLAASYQEQGRRYLLDGYPRRALSYLVTAREAGIDTPTLRFLWAQASRGLAIVSVEHRRWVSTAAFSPDGSRIVTASEDKTARVWDAATGKAVTPPLQHEGVVSMAAFSPDGARIVTASEDKSARVWDAATGKALTPAMRHEEIVWMAAFSPDGSRILTASSNESARVWDARTGKALTPAMGHEARVGTAMFSPDGSHIITGGRLWDATTGKAVTPAIQHGTRVQSAQLSPDGSRIVTASFDGTARVWDVAIGKALTPPMEHAAPVSRAAFSPDGSRIITASYDKTARVWDAATGKRLSPLMEHDSFVLPAFTPDGTRILTVSLNRMTRVLDVATGKPVSLPMEHEATIRAASFSPDGSRIVTASGTTVRVWNAPLEQVVIKTMTDGPSVWRHESSFNRGPTFSPNGARIITASMGGGVWVWDAKSGKRVFGAMRRYERIRAAAFSPDGSRIVTAGDRHIARVLDASTGNPVTPEFTHDGLLPPAFSPDGTRIVTLSGTSAQVRYAATGTPVTPPMTHGRQISTAMFSADGSLIVTASGDTALVWDAAASKRIAPPMRHVSKVTMAVFSPDATRILTVSDWTARVWDAVTGELVCPPIHHDNDVVMAAFSLDGARVVTASHDKSARVWDAATGKALTPVMPHEDVVWMAAFSPDGSRILTASADGTARLWDAVTGLEIIEPLQHPGIHAAAFSGDGFRIVTAGSDGTVRVWDASLDEGTLADWRAVAHKTGISNPAEVGPSASE